MKGMYKFNSYISQWLLMSQWFFNNNPKAYQFPTTKFLVHVMYVMGAELFTQRKGRLGKQVLEMKIFHLKVTHNTCTDISRANVNHVVLPNFKQDRENKLLYAWEQRAEDIGYCATVVTPSTNLYNQCVFFLGTTNTPIFWENAFSLSSINLNLPWHGSAFRTLQVYICLSLHLSNGYNSWPSSPDAVNKVGTLKNKKCYIVYKLLIYNKEIWSGFIHPIICSFH